MSQSALAALLGKKTVSSPTSSAPSATPTPASATVATPAATSAAAPTLLPTPAPALAAAPSSPPPAAAPGAAAPALTATPGAALAASAPAPRPEPGPNAVSTPTPEGSPPDTLAALLGDFTAAAGKAPRVNPPQAAAVLAGPTAKEVAGHPEPPEVAEEKVAPVPKPADVLAAEQAPKSRRTAAVVQVELDAALAAVEKYRADYQQLLEVGSRPYQERIAQLEKTLQETILEASQSIVAARTENLIGATAPEGDEDLAASAVALIEQLRAEAAVSLEDNRKAWARVAALEEQLEKVTAGALRAGEFVEGQSALRADAIEGASLEQLCAAICDQGFEPTLRFVGAS